MAKPDKPFTTDDFRAELVKIMPGYNWTVHRARKGDVRMFATGTQSSGFNRLSTLCIERSIARGAAWYTAKSAGFGTRARFAGENSDGTLARALRGLQDHYTRTANEYRSLAARLQAGRVGDGVGEETQPNG